MIYFVVLLSSKQSKRDISNMTTFYFYNEKQEHFHDCSRLRYLNYLSGYEIIVQVKPIEINVNFTIKCHLEKFVFIIKMLFSQKTACEAYYTIFKYILTICICNLQK